MKMKAIILGLCLLGATSVFGKDWTPIDLFGSAGKDASIYGLRLLGVYDAEEMYGLSISLLNGMDGPSYEDSLVAGIHVGVLCNFYEEAHGVIQISGIANGIDSPKNEGAAGDAVQIAGLVNGAGNLSGMQIAGFGNIADVLYGVQIGGFLNKVDETGYGMQIGTVNHAKRFYGVQIGVINHVENMSGIQIGVINIIENSSVPWMPIINCCF